MRITIPYGSFKLADCFGKTRWYPNELLKMSPKEQFDYNIKSGVFDGMDIISSYGYYDGLKKETKC